MPKLYILFYDEQNCPGDWPPLETPCPPLAPKVEVLEPPRSNYINNICNGQCVIATFV